MVKWAEPMNKVRGRRCGQGGALSRSSCGIYARRAVVSGAATTASLANVTCHKYNTQYDHCQVFFDCEPFSVIFYRVPLARTQSYLLCWGRQKPALTRLATWLATDRASVPGREVPFAYL